jgi:leucyl-tRNA synthetase
MPVRSYIGGNEHAVLHLLYARFITMVLHDASLVGVDEPFRTFRAHGLIVKDGAKMSKSRGNVVSPDEYIGRWGADTFRTYLMFLGPFQEGGDFRDAGISGPRRYLDKVWDMVTAAVDPDCRDAEIRREVMVKWHQTKKKVTQEIEVLHYNTAIAAQMELVALLREQNCTECAVVTDLVKMIAPFAPHFAEECWERLGNSGSVLCFRVGPADAALLDGLFPTVPRHRLQTLPPHTFAVTFGDRDLITPAPPPLEGPA